jgi:spore germination cell wall hydrolase CwlJ-like protein
MASLITSPPVWKLEKSWRMARGERRRILSERKRRLARKLAARKRYLREKTCLATALYFEARSEGVRGQQAVAQVILNRVKDPRFPNTICGVVYQGAERRNSCQFSFACDGKPDIPTQRKAWAQSRKLAAKALSGKLGMQALAGVTYYHADYVRPRWASAMRKIARIGRHIFYRHDG